jgi:hypothetical protein
MTPPMTTARRLASYGQDPEAPKKLTPAQLRRLEHKNRHAYAARQAGKRRMPGPEPAALIRDEIQPEAGTFSAAAILKAIDAPRRAGFSWGQDAADAVTRRIRVKRRKGWHTKSGSQSPVYERRAGGRERGG